MSNEESPPQNESTQDKQSSNIVRSSKRSAKDALDYWTKDKLESAKPRPMPRVKRPTPDTSEDDTNN